MKDKITVIPLNCNFVIELHPTKYKQVCGYISVKSQSNNVNICVASNWYFVQRAKHYTRSDEYRK